MKLLRLLKNKPFCNDFHFILIGALLFLIAIKYPFISIFLIIYLIFILKKTKYIIPTLITIGIIYLSYYFIINERLKIRDYYEGEIIEVIDDSSYIINIDNIKIMGYEKHNYAVGDVIECCLSINSKTEKSYEMDFDYYEYLLSKNIIYTAKVTKSKKIGNFFTINSIRYNYLKYLKGKLSNTSYQYVEAIVFGQNNLDADLREGYQILGLSHILAISGLHILMLYKIISLILIKLFKYRYRLIPIVIISIYVIIIGCPASCLRALLFLIIGALNDNDKIKYTKLDILSISMLMMLIVNPFQIYQIGFILSYLVSFILIYSNEIIKKGNKLIKNYKQHILIYILTFPFIATISNKLSITSLLLAPILTIITTFIIIPISFILAIFPILNLILNPIISVFNQYIIGLNNSSISLNVLSFNIYIKILYYIFVVSLILSIIRKRRIVFSTVFFVLFMTVIINYRLFIPFHKITFIDVGQGDSTLIELKNNTGVVLIDAYNCYDYLMSIGLTRIDYLILTHSDTDHIKDTIKILDEFDVNKILIPKYDDGFEILKGYSYQEVDYNNSFYLSNAFFDIIGPINKYNEKNSNSIVIKMHLNDKKFLFCGDMTIEAEYDLIDYYKEYLACDVIKIGHHGSNTSTSELFLSYVNPTYSVISVGMNNYYGLPNDDVIDRLSKYDYIYQTRYNGNIEFYIYDKKMWATSYK